MAWKTGLRWHVIAAAGAALALTAAALAVALAAAAGINGNGQQLGQHLVPAATATGNLLGRYYAEETWIRTYVAGGRTGQSAGPFAVVDTQAAADQAQVRSLVHGYPALVTRLDRTVAAHRTWLATVVRPQLAAMARGDVAGAQAQLRNLNRTRPHLEAIATAGASLQAGITQQQQVVTNQLTDAQDTLAGALIGMCAVVLLVVAATVTAAWLGLLRPFRALRTATEAIADGDYGTRIPAVGPNELRALARSTELMRMRLVTTLDQREQAEFRFRQLFDAAPDAMIAVEGDGTVTMANTQAVRMFGYPAGEFIGRAVQTLVPAEARAALEQERVRYLADPGTRPLASGLKLTGRRRDGSTFPAEVTLSTMPAERGQLMTAAIRDVSERLVLAAERERLRSAELAGDEGDGEVAFGPVPG